MHNKRTCAIISSQAFSLFNFRGPLISDLVASGVTVYALAPDYDEETRQKVIALGAQPWDYQLVRTGMNPVSDVIDTFRLVQLLRRLRPDVTLGYFIKPVIFGTLAAWLAGVPRRIAMIEGLGYVFTDSEDSDQLRRRVLRSVVGRLYRFALAKAHVVIFLNSDDLNEFVNARIVAKEKVVNLGGIGVNLDEWASTTPVVNPVTFLLAARLLREKGIVEYAEAARVVKQIHPTVRFILLGGLDPNPHCLTLTEVQEWVSLGVLEWPGHVEVRPWMAQASVYVLPSYYREGVPRSTQEAMAMGRAVITSASPGCRDTVDEGVNGFMVPVKNVAELVKAMLRFVENPALIESMGLASRRLAQERFDVNKINAHLLKILDVDGARYKRYRRHMQFRANRPHRIGVTNASILGLLTVSIVSHAQIDLIVNLLHDLERHCKDIQMELILTLNVDEVLTFALEDFSFPIKIIRNAEPIGFSANQNQAFEHATGIYFCVLNPDIRLECNPFNALLTCLEQPAVGVAAPLVYDDAGLIEDSARRFPSPSKILCKFFGGCTGVDYAVSGSLVYPDWVAGMVMLFKRDVMEKLGGFDERYFLYYEDVEICARLRLLGYQAVLCPEAKVIHHARRSSHRNPRYFRWHLKSMARFFLSRVYWQLLFRTK